MKKPTQLLSVQFLTALLVACGGGSDGSSGSATSEGTPVDVTRESATASYSISGHIIAQATARNDSDVNNPVATYASNDSFTLAQSVSTAAIVKGYVNVAGAGPDGRSSGTGDPVDIYSAELEANTTLTLTTQSSQANLQLFLYSSDNLTTPLRSATSAYQTKSITVPSSGDFYVKVVATSGASGYALALKSATGPTAFAASTIWGDFVPGEVLVRYRETGLRSMSSTSRPGQPMGNSIYRVTVDDLIQSDSDMLSAMATGLEFSGRGLFSEDPHQAEKARTLQAVAQLMQRDDVVYAEPNYLVYPAAIPNDPGYAKQSHYNLINLPQAWDIETGDDSVIVAVIDTGIVTDHPDLDEKLVYGYDFISNANYSEDGDGMDPDPSDPGDPSHGISYHGTHVAGTIAASSNNRIGVAGVSWGARIMPLRAISYESGSTADVAEAIRYAARLSNSSGILPAERADIINLSLGGASYSNTLANAVQAARDAGVIVVAAAGNKGVDTPNYPAAYDGVISVSAVNGNRKRTRYSNFGSTIDIAAPGGESGNDSIYSTRNDSKGNIGYGYLQGTSMATPHVAGVLALMKSVNPSLTPARIDELLESGSLTQDLGATGRDNEYGYGLIDAHKAVLAAQNDANVKVDKRNLHLGLSEVPGQLQLTGLFTNTGISVDVEVSDDWLQVLPLSVDGAGLGLYEVYVDRSELAPGSYQSDVHFIVDADTTITTTVWILVSEAESNASTGTQKLILTNAATGDRLESDIIEFSNGIHQFHFETVPRGSYLVTVGSDDNNDGSLCGIGEACGFYPSLAKPQTIRIDHNIDNLDLVSDVVTQPLNANGLIAQSLKANTF